jgi:DNA invertase Pin-like site-specific DNA recombinase
MAIGNFVAYYRVSTQQQGRSGLGLDAQRKAVVEYLNGGAWKLVEEFTEVESGKRNDRPQLQAALQACRARQATLVIAKLDRLSRDAHFLLGLQKAGVPFIAVDMPHADQFSVGVLALVAQKEREMISARTRAALAAAKARGVRLGGRRPGALPDPTTAAQKSAQARAMRVEQRLSDLRPIVERLTGGDVGPRELSRRLNAEGIPAPRGGQWHPASALSLLRRLGLAG